MDGWPVGVLGSDPYFYGGGWTADASNKVTRFVDIAETFHLPVIHLVDNPGFVIGLEAEKQGTIRHGARALTAVYQATVPWCSVILRKVFGVAGAAHMNASRVHYRYAWPSGDWGSLPMEGGIEAAYKSDLEKSDIILVGVSRTSKTPTSIYLANRGYKTSNIPLVNENSIPELLRENPKLKCVVGLTVEPKRLVDVRKNRMMAIKEEHGTNYTNIEKIELETKNAKETFKKYQWPVIDVTRKSVEEIAASIIKIYEIINQNE